MSSSQFKINIVEDDPWYGQILQHHLSMNPDYSLEIFTSAKDLLNNLFRKPDLICMDFGLPDMKGDKLLREIHARNKQVPVIVISAQEEISVAVELLKAGAKDYIIKDDHTKEQLWKSILHIRENIHLRQEVEVLKEQLGQKFSFENTIIGQSDAIKRTFNLLQKAVNTNINVSLTGETGTGKEVYAKAIHFNSERKKKPFVAVNMGAIPKELAESELFGHEKGAFTGASGIKTGKFEEAQGGTLFLDEIGELDISLQSKLLRVIQEREIVRVGGNKPIKVDIRLITATHKNLAEEVKQGRFREDLFFRIVGLPIELPPLRNRDNDVIILAKHFIEEFAKANKIKALQLSDAAKSKLRKYAWPGNVRELKAVMDLACVMADIPEIKAEDLTFYEIGENKAYSSEEKTLKAFEVEIIAHFLKKYEDNVVLVADKLDIGKSKIYNMLKNGEIKLN
ncbi:sigma-54-dependent transcriptional regulator [Cognataquiflexum aquatile]|uniref:sigma-54-dependent transcriptional regulator n=1 Tax=Cognataquiflexum aquatile TaxID=2249427 RepID=UPI000DE9C7FE|nr:sigma-54 dependent transcriptional regulator [Cognataquiflexum aquatile]